MPRDSESGIILQKDMETTPLWNLLMFDVSNLVPTHNSSNTSTICLGLKCNLFGKISSDFTHIPIEYLSQLYVTFECWTPNARIHFATLTEYFQYTFTSLMLNLEYKYPFVFSFYGKRFFKINYSSLIRSTREFAVPLDSVITPDHNDIVQRCLRKLQSFILYEYNTLNIMIECDTNSYRRKMCRESVATGNLDYANKSLKNSGFSLRVPASAHLDS